jgi:hypothetical protein
MATRTSETVLGETCHWFVTEATSHLSHEICLTSDGVLLKERVRGSSSGNLGLFTAVHLARRPLSIDEVKPPAELLDPRAWGIE